MTKLLGLFPIEYIGREAGDYLTRVHMTPFRWWPWAKRHYLHIFSRPDNDPHPHDHPFAFRSIILWGGYVEKVFRLHGVGERQWWSTTRRKRRWMTSHRAEADHIHMIEKLSAKKVVTWVIRGPKEQEWGFWVDGPGNDKTKVPWWQYIGLPEKPPAAYGEA